MRSLLWEDDILLHLRGSFEMWERELHFARSAAWVWANGCRRIDHFEKRVLGLICRSLFFFFDYNCDETKRISCSGSGDKLIKLPSQTYLLYVHGSRFAWSKIPFHKPLCIIRTTASFQASSCRASRLSSVLSPRYVVHMYVQSPWAETATWKWDLLRKSESKVLGHAKCLVSWTSCVVNFSVNIINMLIFIVQVITVLKMKTWFITKYYIYMQWWDGRITCI